MLTNVDIVNFFNKLEFAGLRPPCYAEEFKRGMLLDFAGRYASRITSEELRLAGDLLQTSEEWPSYRQLEETLRAIRATQETDTVGEASDAYPDGNAWTDLARNFGQTHFPNMSAENLENNLLALYWLLQENAHCQGCNGKQCRYYGHRPYLRQSQNGTELYKCCNSRLCEKYSRGQELNK